MNQSETVSSLVQVIIAGNRKAAPELAEKLLQSGMDAYEIVTDVCSPAMERVGELYQEEEYFVPEILMSAKAFEAVMQILKPLLLEAQGQNSGTIVIGVCEGDIHTIGKNLVSTMLEAAGFKVIDLGKDVPVDRFIDSAVEYDADIIGASALMTTSMIAMEDIVERVKANGIRSKIMVGGGPVTQSYADSIGADGYGKDAKEAVDVAKRLMEG
jgi:corrinoid protein of di/trimethylamine methyltransferase